MFGLKYRTLLTRDIVEILDDSPDSMTLKEIQVALGYSNVVTIQDICIELSDICEEDNGEKKYYVQFDNRKRGSIKLKRFSTNLQSLYKTIFSQDIAYEIIFELIQKRSYSSVEFCLNHNISKSTLQRKIKQINDELESYNVYITCSDYIKFKAKEINIRLLSFYFLWATHREFSNVSWGLDANYYLGTASAILDYLNIPRDPIKTELTAFIVYIYWNAHSKKKEMKLSENQRKIIDLLKFPSRPNILSSWSSDEWKMFVVALSNYSAYSPNFAQEQKELIAALKIDFEDFSVFVNRMEVHFGRLSIEKYEYLKGAWMQYHLLIDYFEYPNVFVENLSHIFSLDGFSEEHPAYLNKFELFWQDFLNKQESPESYSSMRGLALLLCVSIFPLNANMLNHTIYLTSDVNDLLNNFLKERILFRYDKKYDIDFVSCFEEADLVISTVPLRKEQLREGQKNVTLSAHLREKDFSALDDFFLTMSKAAG